jgi:hypothetical protein
LASCQRDQLKDILSELQQAQQQASERAGTSEVAVNLNHRRFLTIGIANSRGRRFQLTKGQKALGSRGWHAGLAPKVRLEVVTVSFSSTDILPVLPTMPKDAHFNSSSRISRRDLAKVSEQWVPTEKPPEPIMPYLRSGRATRFAERSDDALRRDSAYRSGPLSLLFDRATFDRQRSQTIADELISAVDDDTLCLPVTVAHE